MASKIDPRKIRSDCDTQSRVEMNETIIADYADAMERGDEFPPILVFFDENTDDFILADGFHRFAAHMRVRPNDPILAEQQIGTVEDARWASLAANQAHGLHRTNADKQNAVRRALLHPKGCELSDRQLGRHVGVDNKTVANIRHKLESTEEVPQSNLRKGGDGRVINTKNIVKKTKSEPYKSCASCRHYKDDFCEIDNEGQAPWTPACDMYATIPQVKEQAVVPPTPKEYNIIDAPKQKNETPVRKNKPRNTVGIDVPIDNPQLAAVEMRSMLGEDYLRQCFIAVRMLLANTHNDDPFPELNN